MRARIWRRGQHAGLRLGALVLLGVATLPLPSRAQIAGGQPIDIREAPWQVALRIKTGDAFTLCGGAVIDPNWVLTAAHCLPAAVKPEDVKVITGTSDCLDGGRWIPVRDVVLHEAYDPATNVADLALLRVAMPIEGVAIAWSSTVAELPSGTPLTVTGWGATAEGGQKSRQLMRAVVPYVDNPTCNRPGVLRRPRPPLDAVRWGDFRRPRRLSGRQRGPARSGPRSAAAARRCHLLRRRLWPEIQIRRLCSRRGLSRLDRGDAARTMSSGIPSLLREPAAFRRKRPSAINLCLVACFRDEPVSTQSQHALAN